MAGTYNISADQGSTLLVTITWSQPPVGSATTGDPVDITGYTARMQVRSASGATDLELDLATAENTEALSPGTIVLGGTTGTVQLNVPATVMQGVAAGSYKYDLYLSSADNPPIVTRLIQGSFKVTSEITNPQ